MTPLRYTAVEFRTLATGPRLLCAYLPGYSANSLGSRIEIAYKHVFWTVPTPM